jgi:type II secretory pathway component PulM
MNIESEQSIANQIKNGLGEAGEKLKGLLMGALERLPQQIQQKIFGLPHRNILIGAGSIVVVVVAWELIVKNSRRKKREGRRSRRKKGKGNSTD